MPLYYCNSLLEDGMATKAKNIAQNPLILRCHRLMEAFAKSDDERDFYLDRTEGFLIYIDLDKSQEELDALEKELKSDSERSIAIPKLTFYEIKKIMEGFVNEKVYDIDTKEKLLDIISSKEARENFLEFIYDHHSELEKWQQYYQERFRVRIIEWLRNNQFDFVFEEDLELTKAMVEKLKMNTFTPRVGKDIMAARKILVAKAKTYYSNEALNPRPKRGRPPKQVAKVETEPQFSQDIYLTTPKSVKPFVFAPDYRGAAAVFTFSGKYTSEEELLAHRRQQIQSSPSIETQSLSQKLAALRSISGSGYSQDQLLRARHAQLNGDGVLKRDHMTSSLDLDGKSSREKAFGQKKSTPQKESDLEKKSDKKPAPKMRLRPLPQKDKGKNIEAAKEKNVKKGKEPLRHLRRAKKI